MNLRKIVAGLGVALGSLLLALVATEVALRFTYPGQLVIDRFVPRVGRMRVPSQRGYQFGNERENEWVRLTVNARGLRGEEIPEEKAPGEVRVLCVGDSFVFGGGLADADTFPAQAQRLAGLPPEKLRFMNGGGNGYDTREAASFLEVYAPPLLPDVVVLGWNWNDLVSIDWQGTFALEPEWLRSFAIHKFWKYHHNPKEWKPTTPERFAQYRNDVLGCATGPDAPRRWGLARDAMQRLVGASKQMRAKTFVLVMPELTWKESPQFPALARLTSILESYGVPWVDAQPQFYKAFREGVHVVQNLDPFHPSAEGQGIQARVLLEALRKLGWIPGS